MAFRPNQLVYNAPQLQVPNNNKGLLDAAALVGTVYDFFSKNNKDKKAAEERQQRYDDLYNMYLKQTGQIPPQEDMTYNWSSELPELVEEPTTEEEKQKYWDIYDAYLNGGR